MSPIKKISPLFKRLFKPSAFKFGVFICICCVTLLIKHYTISKNSIDFVGKLETVLYDMRFKLRGEKSLSGIVGVLSADDRSVERFGRWPFPRSIYAQAFKNLKNAGVQWIGLDVFFTEATRKYLDESIPDLIHLYKTNLSLPKLMTLKDYNIHLNELINKNPSDELLGNSFKKYGTFVQGFFFVNQKEQIIESIYDWTSSSLRLQNSALDFVDLPIGKKITDYPDIISYGAVTNIPIIAGHNPMMGFANNNSDTDGLIRKALLVRGILPINNNGTKISEAILVPSLALSIVANYLNSGIVTHFDYGGIESIDLIPTDAKSPVIKIPNYLDGTGYLLLNHYGSFSKIPTISLEDAYDNRLQKQLPQILILGGTATGINDKRPSPFDENFDGVGHHVTVIENIIKKDFMTRPLTAPIIELSILILTGILFSFILKHLNALKSAIFILLLIVIFYLLDKKYLFGNGNWYYVGMFYVQSLSIYFAVSIFKYFTEEREKKKVKIAFQHYLNPSVINQLMEHPDRLRLGGEKKELTVFFSDVRGFTTISEILSPEKLTTVLNQYFTPMTKIVLDTGGLLDKYIGDAMMAVWGAPIDILDHADKALHSSLLMMEKLSELQEKWRLENLPEIDIGIGINTGDMVVGNMGSDQRFDYTVLGDAVNLGSRLEGSNKIYGTHIICSEFTKNATKNPQNFIFRELDKIKVKGKNKAVTIFELVICKESEKETYKKMIHFYEEGLNEYRQKNWDLAIGKFTQALKTVEQDPPSKEFIERCIYLKEHSVDNDWDSIWISKTK